MSKTKIIRFNCDTLTNIVLENKDQNSCTTICSSSYGYNRSYILDEDQEIIGLYGTKANEEAFSSIGFLTWNPSAKE